MQINRLLVIALALLIPLSYTSKTRSLRTEDAIAFGIFGTVFVGVPIAIGSYFLYKNTLS